MEGDLKQGSMPPSNPPPASSMQQRLPIIGAAIAVVFIISGVMRAILSLFSSTAVAQSAALELCVSSTIGDRTAVDLVNGFYARLGARNVTQDTDPKTGALDLSAHVPGSLSATHIQILMTDSGNAFNRLASRECNVALVSRGIDPIEMTLFHVAPAATLIALDGAVLVVHPSNPVRSLSIHQLRAIFSGQYRNWNSFSPYNHPIHVILPDKSSDAISLFTSRVLEGQVPTSRDPRSSTVGIDVSGPLQFGYIGLTTFHASDPARIIRITDGSKREFTPSTLSIGRRVYPLTIPLYAYREDSNMTNSAYQFITFIDSSEGQHVLVDDNFISPFVF